VTGAPGRRGGLGRRLAQLAHLSAEGGARAGQGHHLRHRLLPLRLQRQHPRTVRPEVVGRELRVIGEDLHCNAVRVTGGDPDRLELAASHAAEVGLEVWLSPFTCDLTTGQLLDLLADRYRG
jgi:hypothetical protein